MKKIKRAKSVDPLEPIFQQHMARLKCSVPLVAIGNGNFMFGTKKIFGKL